MFDQSVTILTALAFVLWITGGALVLTGQLGASPHLGQVGLLAAGLGGVINIRGFIDNLTERERNAFEVGRQYERPGGGVRSLR